MAQHFLLSAASRTLSLRTIYKADEDAAYQTFCNMRWPETQPMSAFANGRILGSNNDWSKRSTGKKYGQGRALNLSAANEALRY
jgi:hypothetical protein